jgi:hypothetical protein
MRLATLCQKDTPPVVNVGGFLRHGVARPFPLRQRPGGYRACYHPGCLPSRWIGGSDQPP